MAIAKRQIMRNYINLLILHSTSPLRRRRPIKASGEVEGVRVSELPGAVRRRRISIDRLPRGRGEITGCQHAADCIWSGQQIESDAAVGIAAKFRNRRQHIGLGYECRGICSGRTEHSPDVETALRV